MSTLERLGSGELRAVVLAYRDALAAHREPINRLNVYPVPDGDTGTNMALTLDSVCKALPEPSGGDPSGTGDNHRPGETGADADRAGSNDMAALCHAVSHGSLMGARGNSGVILSQVLRGMSNVISEADGLDAPTLAKALHSASDAAYQAVMRPVEGTILTVVRASAEGATGATHLGGDLKTVAEAARSAAADALERTPELLPVLADAGVVDAGGAGYLLLLDSLLHVIDQRPIPEPAVGEGAVRADAQLVHTTGEEFDHNVSDLRYEVMYFLEAPDEAVPAFKDVWAGIGDSIVVVGGDGIWNCHIHTDDIGSAVEAALDAGRPRSIRVTDLHEEIEEERWVREATGAGEVVEAPAHAHEPVTTAVVAVAAGDGIKRIFYSLGVQGVVPGGQSMNPSTEELLEVVERVPADEVVILPNNKNIIPVAEQVAGHTSKHVRVVPTRGSAEAFAALIGYDPEAPADENAGEMKELAGGVVAGEVTRAVRDSTSDVGPIAEGDYLGMARDGIRVVRPALSEAVIELLEGLVTSEHEMVTVIQGEGATPAVTRQMTEWLAEHRPNVEVETHQGGQPLYPYLFGIE